MGRVHRDRAQVQRVLEGTAAMRERKGDALRDGVATELDDVVVHFGIFEGLQEILAFRRVVESMAKLGPTRWTASSSSSRAIRDVEVLDAATS